MWSIILPALLRVCIISWQRVDSFAWDTTVSENEGRGCTHSSSVALAASMGSCGSDTRYQAWMVVTLRPPLASLQCSLASACHPSHETAPWQGTFTSSGHTDGLPSALFQLEPSAEPATALGRTSDLWFVLLSHSPLPSLLSVREMSGFPLYSQLIFSYPLTSRALTFFLEHP